MNDFLYDDLLMHKSRSEHEFYESEKNLEQHVVFLHYCSNTLSHIIGYYPRYYPEHSGTLLIRQREFFYSLHMEPVFYALWKCIELYNRFCFDVGKGGANEEFALYLLPSQDGEIYKGEGAYLSLLAILEKQSADEILSFIHHCHTLMQKKRIPVLDICSPLLEEKESMSLICSKLYKHLSDCYPILFNSQVKYYLNNNMSVPPVL